MSTTVNQDFIRGSDRRQAWMLNIAAAAVVAVAAVACIGYRTVYPSVSSSDTIDVRVDVPSVAPGVHTGTKVILRGNEVGEVTALTRRSDDTVRMNLALRPNGIRGLTDALDIDFRPENYFGVTAVNLLEKPGGGKLAAGDVLNRRAANNFTMSTMLEKGSIVVDGTLTKAMIDTLDKVVRYADGLTPMIQAGIVFADRVAQTQQAMPSILLDDMNRTLDVLPGFTGQSIAALYNLYDNNTNHGPNGSWGRDDAYWDDLNTAMDVAMVKLFGAAGSLLQSHDHELTPVTGLAAALFGATPTLLANGRAASQLSAMVDRYGTVFTGPDSSRTLNLRLILDNLPGVAAPLAVSGLPSTLGQEQPR